MQVKKYGRTKKTIEETIRICSDKEAMNALQIAPSDQRIYLPMLKKG